MAKIVDNFFITCVVLLQATWILAIPLNQTNVCLEPITVGVCRSEVISYGFDSKEQKCVQFVYGGCGGNNNRFNDMKDCQSACEACSQSMEAGPCFGLMERYAFDQNEKKCVKFNYGGCMGNKNNFEQLQDCEHNCMKN